jgi:two-component system nitrate/nitrite response regulator NarL
MIAPLRIAIADEHPLFRKGLRELLALQANLKVVAEIDRFDALEAALDATPCDLLLLYFHVSQEALPHIRQLAVRIPIIVVTGGDRLDDAIAAISSGARGVVLKRLAVDMLVDAIRVVSAGQVSIPPVLQTHLVRGYHEAPHIPLTPREREITCLVARGLRNCEVARTLCICEQTVKTHLNNVFHKLDLRDRVELTLYAARVGLIGVHDQPQRRPLQPSRSAA